MMGGAVPTALEQVRILSLISKICLISRVKFSWVVQVGVFDTFTCKNVTIYYTLFTLPFLILSIICSIRIILQVL